MIKYAGAPQLGDYVMVLDDTNKVYQVDKIEIAIDVWCYLSGSTGRWSSEHLTRVKPYWNVGELVRYKGRVHQILIIEVKNYKFVYSLEDIGQWITEDELEEVNSIRHSLHLDDWISVNKYCTDEHLRGMKGRINTINYLGASCFLRGIGPQSYDLPWEAINVIEEKVEPYNAELICIESKDNTLNVGDIVKIENGTLHYRSNGRVYRYPYDKFNNIEDVNKSFTTARFAEIKETIGDKAGWNGKFYVVDAIVGSPVKVGNMYVVREGILNVGGYSFTQRFISFNEIQERFDYATLIEVKE